VLQVLIRVSFGAAESIKQQKKELSELIREKVPSASMISMELQPAVHMQHLNHHSQQPSHHGDLNVYQHQMTNLSGDDEKSKSKYQLRDPRRIPPKQNP